MTDLDPEIWNTPNLGSASPVPFMDEVEAQRVEDYDARLNNREPLIARRAPEDRAPHFMEPHTVPSSVDIKVNLTDPNAPEEFDFDSKDYE
jgi:hypothetical protein